MTVAILGCGYTGQRLADRLARRAVDVIPTSRRARPGRVRLDVTEPFDLAFIPEGAVVVVSIPNTSPDATPRIVEQLRLRNIARLIYLSTTGVYGDTTEVDHTTPPAPRAHEHHVRLCAEQAYAAGPWPTLILRPAAIYGPGRGVHARMVRGDYVLPGDGSHFVSRIHVDDLAAVLEAAAFHCATGTFPVADDEPCTSRTMADFCARLLALPLPAENPAAPVRTTLQANRRVDGREIRKILGVRLEYPSYRDGVPAAVHAAK